MPNRCWPGVMYVFIAARPNPVTHMLTFTQAFANAVQTKYKNHVRLSIHSSTGASKLSVSLLPTDTFYTTPWHCTIAFLKDGTVTSGMRSDFESDPRFELVYKDERPAYYREQSDLYSWGEAKGGVECDPLYPAGVLIKPKMSGSMSMEDIDATKVRALSEMVSPVVLRGFGKSPVRESFISKAHEFGEPLPWKFGLVLEVKDRGSSTGGLNNVLSAEWMPFHFDGLFKTQTITDDDGKHRLVPVPPR